MHSVCLAAAHGGTAHAHAGGCTAHAHASGRPARAPAHARAPPAGVALRAERCLPGRAANERLDRLELRHDVLQLARTHLLPHVLPARVEPPCAHRALGGHQSDDAAAQLAPPVPLLHLEREERMAEEARLKVDEEPDGHRLEDARERALHATAARTPMRREDRRAQRHSPMPRTGEQGWLRRRRVGLSLHASSRRRTRRRPGTHRSAGRCAS
eukprot:6055361-Prymnesium_polylepis.1